MNVPEPWTFALLALATYRVWRLLAEDTILDRPREWLLRGDPSEDDDVQPIEYRDRLAYWLTCPFCAGAYVSAAWWLAFVIWPHGTLVVAVPFALSGAVAVFAAHLDP